MLSKMRKKWTHRELEVFGISPGREASLSPGSGSNGARGQELAVIFGGVGSGRVGVGIRNDNDQSYQRTFSTFFGTLVFRVSVADDFEMKLNYRR